MSKELPITKFKHQIVNTVRKNQVTIVVGLTGSGKSTQLPQYMRQAGYNVLVTQPRRMAAAEVSKRVAWEYGCNLGETIGYRTAFEGASGPTTECLYVTDGLALAREFRGHGRHDLIIIDEVHEWNLNIALLVAWVQKKISEDEDVKVVIMSATMEAEALSKYFGNAPIINIPGRMFHIVEEKPRGENRAENAAYYLRRSQSVLIYEPGKKELYSDLDLLMFMRWKQGLNAEILPLHADLTPEEQALCMLKYKKPLVVVSTDVAQSSVTPQVKVVIDSGLHKVLYHRNGVEILCLESISLACREQRKGRTGRIESGIYVDWCEQSKRPKYPLPAILRENLDHLVLRILDSGHGVEDFNFFHQPPKRSIEEAKLSLYILGCTDANGKVTPIGHQVAKLPVSVRFGRMIVEGIKLGVVEEILIIASILEQRGITIHKSAAWKKLCKRETTSDVMAQLCVWEAAKKMSEDEMLDYDISAKAFMQAQERYEHLKMSLDSSVREQSGKGDRDNILQAVCAGMFDLVFDRAGQFWAGKDGDPRVLSKDSVVQNDERIIGLPFDIEYINRHGELDVVHTIGMATVVDNAMLSRAASHLRRSETKIAAMA